MRLGASGGGCARTLGGSAAGHRPVHEDLQPVRTGSSQASQGSQEGKWRRAFNAEKCNPRAAARTAAGRRFTIGSRVPRHSDPPSPRKAAPGRSATGNGTASPWGGLCGGGGPRKCSPPSATYIVEKTPVSRFRLAASCRAAAQATAETCATQRTRQESKPSLPASGSEQRHGGAGTSSGPGRFGPTARRAPPVGGLSFQRPRNPAAGFPPAWRRAPGG